MQDPLELVDNTKYQVFLMSCPAELPFVIGGHSWFVVNKRGVVARWEILFENMSHETRWGHLYKNYFAPFQGIGVFSFLKRVTWRRGALMGCVEGVLAERMIECIEGSPEKYPLCHQYALRGPNSNTYVAWVLAQFPEFPGKLPWNAFGKNYDVKSI